MVLIVGIADTAARDSSSGRQSVVVAAAVRIRRTNQRSVVSDGHWRRHTRPRYDAPIVASSVHGFSCAPACLCVSRIQMNTYVFQALAVTVAG